MQYRRLGVFTSGVNEDPCMLPHQEVLDLILGPTREVDQPEVRAIAVSSLNGASSVDGASGGLGNSLDLELLFHLRAWADVVVVGTGTIIKEKYCGVKLNEHYRASRVNRGQEDTPPVGILSTSLPFTTQSKIFMDTVVPPMIITEPASREKAAALEPLCQDVVLCDTSDPHEIVRNLKDRGYNRILLEGGPVTLKAFLVHDMVDVFHHTIDPSIVTPTVHPLVPSDDESQQTRISFRTDDVVVTDDGVIFARMVR